MSSGGVFVIVTIAEDSKGTERIFVYGPHSTRYFAQKEADRMREDDRVQYPDSPPVRFIVRKILTDPPKSNGET